MEIYSLGNSREEPADAFVLGYGPFQDCAANAGNIKGKIILVLFRLATVVRANKFLCILFFWYLLIYRIFVEWFLNVELHWNVKVGKGLCLMHGHGTVINGTAVIGENCTLRHLTTIGNKKLADGSFGLAPKIGNNVDIGANSVIIGEISIGNNVTIGAGSVVTKSFPSDCIIVGNPARILKHKTHTHV
jgi:putative colanic acid biosynthesis acetyltransferase WcaB